MKFFQSPRAAVCGGAIAAAASLLAGPAAAGVVLDISDFTNACAGTLTCVGNTAVAGTALRLTPAAVGQSGAGFGPAPIDLGAGATFSTVFQFRFTNAGGIDPADGITFVLSKSSSGLGVSGGGLGYQGVGNSVAIEFDTYDNGEVGGSNHVGVDANGVLANNGVSPYGVSTCDFGPAGYLKPGCMSNGDVWTATISYDGTTKLLNVLLQDGAGAVESLFTDYAIDIESLLGTTSAYVGFTAGTGSGYENQDILNWRLANDTSLGGGDVPEPASFALAGVALLAAGVARRTRR